MAVCGIKFIDLTKDAIKILGFLFSNNNENIELERNFKKAIIGIEKALRMWRRIYLTLKGTNIIFKTLALSKFVFLAQVSPIANESKGILMELQQCKS